MLRENQKGSQKFKFNRHVKYENEGIGGWVLQL